MKINSIFGIGIVVFLMSCDPSRRSTSKMSGKDAAFLPALLNQYPTHFKNVLENKDNNVQIIYTKIDRRRNNKPVFTDYLYNVNESEYFYPASTVKLPIAVLALQKLNELDIQGLNRKTTIITETAFEKQTPVYNDPSTADGRPTIEHYIKKIFLVSDNDAFNRLYEFLGQEYINNTLHQMGFNDVQLVHRLSIAMNEEQNRNTNPVRFYDTASKLIYTKPAERSNLVYEQRNTKKGIGYLSGDKIINEPFDFSGKNKIGLQSLQEILKRVLFPKAFSKKQRFKLTDEDYRFLYTYMSMLPGESKYPVYDTGHYWDNYAKFLLYGADKSRAESQIRIFNKIGQAYGYLTDVAYVADLKNDIEFMLTATIHCNSDGIYNDDKYDYEKVGLPFLKNLGRVIYEHELKRQRKVSPDLSHFQFTYTE